MSSSTPTLPSLSSCADASRRHCHSRRMVVAVLALSALCVLALDKVSSLLRFEVDGIPRFVPREEKRELVLGERMSSFVWRFTRALRAKEAGLAKSHNKGNATSCLHGERVEPLLQWYKYSKRQSNSNRTNDDDESSLSTRDTHDVDPYADLYDGDDSDSESGDDKSNEARAADVPRSNDASEARPRLLIAQYSGYGDYVRLLNLTAPISDAYARKHKHDLVVVVGTMLVVPYDEGCEPPPKRSAFDKIELLQMALDGGYDQLLLLDADAVMYDLNYDVTTLLPEFTDLLAAHAVRIGQVPHTYNINNGVTLWNLRHPLAREVAKEWHDLSYEACDTNPKHGNDQRYLHQALKSKQWLVRASRGEFQYRRGTVVKHFIRHTFENWTATGIDEREELLTDLIADDICDRHWEECLT